MKTFVTKTLVIGVFLAVPAGALGYALYGIGGKLRKLAEPLADNFDVDSFVGLLTLDALVVLAFVAAVFLVGLFAYLPPVAKRVKRIDQRLEGYIPGYIVLKGIIGGALNQEAPMDGFKTVLARYNGTAQIGFEVDRTDTGAVVVFLPGSPSPRSGITAVFEAVDIEPLSIPPHKALEMLTFFGKGVSEAVEVGQKQRGLGLTEAP